MHRQYSAEPGSLVRCAQIRAEIAMAEQYLLDLRADLEKYERSAEIAGADLPADVWRYIAYHLFNLPRNSHGDLQNFCGLRGVNRYLYRMCNELRTDLGPEIFSSSLRPAGFVTIDEITPESYRIRNDVHIIKLMPDPYINHFGDRRDNNVCIKISGISNHIEILSKCHDVLQTYCGRVALWFCREFSESNSPELVRWIGYDNMKLVSAEEIIIDGHKHVPVYECCGVHTVTIFHGISGFALAGLPNVKKLNVNRCNSGFICDDFLTRRRTGGLNKPAIIMSSVSYFNAGQPNNYKFILEESGAEITSSGDQFMVQPMHLAARSMNLLHRRITSSAMNIFQTVYDPNPHNQEQDFGVDF